MNIYNFNNKDGFLHGETKPQFLEVAHQKLRLMGTNGSGQVICTLSVPTVVGARGHQNRRSPGNTRLQVPHWVSH